MKSTRQIIAVTFLATALCAVRPSLAVPIGEAIPANPPLARAACQMAIRFNRAFHRDISHVALVRDERPIVAAKSPSTLIDPATAALFCAHPAPLRVEHLRLPPPRA